MKKIGTLIFTMRKSRKMTQDDLALACGVSRSAVAMWEKDDRLPSRISLEALADAFNVPITTFLMEEKSAGEVLAELKKGTSYMPVTSRKVPILGNVAAGIPILAQEEHEEYIYAPPKADYALRICGDSMDPVYLDGDIVFIHQQESVPDGSVAVVLTEDSATVKRVYFTDNGITLASENPKYAPMHISKDKCLDTKILGTVVGFVRIYNN